MSEQTDTYTNLTEKEIRIYLSSWLANQTPGFTPTEKDLLVVQQILDTVKKAWQDYVLGIQTLRSQNEGNTHGW